MALILCEDCGKEISDRAGACPHCGCPVEPREAEIDAESKLTVDEILRKNGFNEYLAIKEVALVYEVSKKDAKEMIKDEVKDKKYTFSERMRTSLEVAGQKQKAVYEQQRNEKREGKQAEKERIAQMDRDGVAYCPKCKSTSLSAHKKGFGIGKAVVGAIATGGIGLVAGNIGAKKVRVTCMKCGHQFWAGQK